MILSAKTPKNSTSKTWSEDSLKKEKEKSVMTARNPEKNIFCPREIGLFCF